MTNILIIALLYLFGFICGYFFKKYRNKQRILNLCHMITSLNNNDYTMNMRQDDFSKLEDDVYKLFLEIVEERKNVQALYEIQAKNLEDISHQIKTPLTAMSFQLENDEEKIDTEKLLKQITHLTELTDILLKLSSLEANLTKMKKEEIELDEIVEYAMEILQGEIQKRNITINKNLSKEKIRGDYYWLCEAFINILKNAIEVSSNKSILIYSERNPLYTSLIVCDQGGGIPKENINKLFQRFYKTPTSHGFGIGLSIAKEVIESNSGVIEVENTSDGAKFTLKFYNVT